MLASLLADYRLGNFDAVATRFANAPQPLSDLDASIRGVEAAALARLGRGSEAASALQRARTAHDRLPKPGQNFETDPLHWCEMVRAEILIKEAAGLIPKAPTVAHVGSSPREQASRRERKGRADELSAREALALIRLDIGQKNEAEAELESVLSSESESRPKSRPTEISRPSSPRLIGNSAGYSPSPESSTKPWNGFKERLPSRRR